MSPRKKTVDDLDDVDDQDGAAEQDARQKSDLKLRIQQADDVALGGTSLPDQGPRADEQDQG
jgi:hypothetical protein